MYLPLVVLIWDGIVNALGNMSTELIGNPLLIGAIIFLFILTFALALLIPFEGLVVIMIPTTYLIYEHIPPLRIIVGILIGFVIGLGLLKWIRR
jgi:hypothetical protein